MFDSRYNVVSVVFMRGINHNNNTIPVKYQMHMICFNDHCESNGNTYGTIWENSIVMHHKSHSDGREKLWNPGPGSRLSEKE